MHITFLIIAKLLQILLKNCIVSKLYKGHILTLFVKQTYFIELCVKYVGKYNKTIFSQKENDVIPFFQILYPFTIS